MNWALRNLYFRLTHKDCVILNVQYRLCFTKVCKIGRIFDKNLFILGTKLNILKNVLLRVEREVRFPWEHCFSLQLACSELQREEPSARDKTEFVKAVQPRVIFKKSGQQTRTGNLCLLQYFKLHGSTLGRDFVSWDTSSRTLFVKLLRMFVRSRFLSAFIVTLGDFCASRQVYSMCFTDFFYRHLILCNAIS